MKIQNRKVLKLGIDLSDLDRLVKIHETEKTNTLASTLVFLLDFYERESSADARS
jgi:hypothetical protein